MDNASAPEASRELLARWRDGDQRAATELWQRYATRLIALTRSRLSAKLNRHLDPEDVVQSAYRSFFAGVRDDRYVLQHSGDLWRLLVAITLHKLQRQVKRHRTGKRSVELEVELSTDADRLRQHAHLLAHEPSPDEAAALADELELVMRDLEPVHRRVVEMRLQGYQQDEIADATACHVRTVRRVLKRVTERLRQQCADHAAE